MQRNGQKLNDFEFQFKRRDEIIHNVKLKSLNLNHLQRVNHYRFLGVFRPSESKCN